MVILANKFICSWGCQIGTLQDFIFRLNRDSKDRKGRFGQMKVPFAITNSIRIVFFLLSILFAFAWAMDIVGVIDPFKIFKPQAIGIAGGVFIVLLMVLSLFIYRPWCHFFCPFGLVGWLAEKVSLFRIKVDYDKCVSCGVCSKACPSTVMDAILKQDRIVPDCFSCGTCIETCPTNAISFQYGKRMRPPAGKFQEQKVEPLEERNIG
jgi:polyferredoxin